MLVKGAPTLTTGTSEVSEMKPSPLPAPSSAKAAKATGSHQEWFLAPLGSATLKPTTTKSSGVAKCRLLD